MYSALVSYNPDPTEQACQTFYSPVIPQIINLSICKAGQTIMKTKRESCNNAMMC